ncbi:MAG: Long-chain-fatty-acid--CoA ligase [Frankiales bacterium]|nr:Long-chain-fatty-acid--CoA ligase [Frankiales bacterium]
MPGPATKSPARTPAKKAADRPTKNVAAAPSSYAERPWVRSYPEGVPGDFEFPKVPLTRLLDDAASSFPTNTALAFLGNKLSYKQLKDEVDRFATALARLGVGKGDRVAIILPNCPQNVITFFAALRLGAVVVEHNPLYTETELRHQLADCGAKVAVCLDRVYETVAKVQKDTALEHVVVTSIADYLPTAKRIQLRLPIAKAKKARAEITADVPKGAPVKHFTALLKAAGQPSRQVPIDSENDLALLQYTGGTTGLSKGAMLTHYNLVSNAYMNRLWDTGATAGKEVTLGVLPLFHAYGLTVAMTGTVLIGGTLVLLPRFDLDLVFAAIDEWKPTTFPGVPPIYKAIADSPKSKQHDLRSIRLCVSGAMKLPVEIQEQFERISGARLIEGYGMTETSPSTHANPVSGTRKPGSIGLPLTGTLCRIVDQEDSSKEIAPGQPGELAISGPQVFRGYWNKSDQDGVFTADGYLLTGDVAVMDDDGFFSIVDRKKEMIIAGGFNIYPSEVEEVLFQLSGVADAVVIGVPDKYRGETVKAFIVKQAGADLTEDDVTAHSAASLAAYKVPKLIEFRTELPRTVVGKVLRRVLVEEERLKAEKASAPKPASVPGGTAGTSTPAPSAKKVAAAKTASVQKAAAKKAPAKTAVATKAVVAKKAAANKPAPVKKAVAKKAAVKKAAAVKKPAPVKKAAVKKAPVKKAPVKKRSARS